MSDHLHLEVARESVTMALYQSLSLLAVLLATPTPGGGEDAGTEVAVIVLLTGLGLLAAHHVAFRMSSRLVNSGALSDDSLRLLRAQAIGGLPVVVLAAVPPLVFGAEAGSLVSEVLLLGDRRARRLPGGPPGNHPNPGADLRRRHPRLRRRGDRPQARRRPLTADLADAQAAHSPHPGRSGRLGRFR